MASIATVVGMGYGSFGDLNTIPTLGYGSGSAPVLPDTLFISTSGASGDTYSRSASGDTYSRGADDDGFTKGGGKA